MGQGLERGEKSVLKESLQEPLADRLGKSWVWERPITGPGNTVQRVIGSGWGGGEPTGKGEPEEEELAQMGS